jgi:hypothetical protein
MKRLTKLLKIYFLKFAKITYMKRTFLFTIGCFLVVALSAQSQIKTSLIYAGTASSSGLNGNPNFGFSLGHQHHLFNRTKFKVVMAENLEYKQAGFIYYNSGFGGVIYTKGDINFVNVKVDTRARIGKDFFFDVGFYASYALLNSISNGKAIYIEDCSPTNANQGTCTEPINRNIYNNFDEIDYGILLGGGFQYKKIVVNLDLQYGLAEVVATTKSILTLQQINLTVAFPISLKKKEVVK